MPLHKSSRGSRLDPTMISAPLGDFRHTMHIGRGGDAFGDTSFLSTLGPSPPKPNLGSPPGSPSSDYADQKREPVNDEPDFFEPLPSFALDLDLDLGPSMLGDVLGVMDGLGLESKSVMPPVESVVNKHNELNGSYPDENQMSDGRIPDGIKPKGPRPKVRFSDKREEIIRLASEEDDDDDDEEDEEEGQEFEFQEKDLTTSPTRERVQRELTPHKVAPPSPDSSHSSDYDGVSALDRRRRVGSSHSESDSEEEEGGRGYTFEDEFDDEIGL
ncbi:cdc42 effector protein 5 [Stigmatopora nigra]